MFYKKIEKNLNISIYRVVRLSCENIDLIYVFSFIKFSTAKTIECKFVQN